MTSSHQSPQTYLQPITKDNAKSALASIELPTFLQSLDELPDASPRAEYIGFASTRSKGWGGMQSAGCQDGTPFAFSDGQYVALTQGITGHLIDVRKFYTTMQGQEGNITKVTIDDVGEPEHHVHYMTFWILRLPGNRMIPIRGDFRRTKSGGFEQAMQSLKLAATPEWLALSDAHKVSAIFPHPWGRVFHTITTTRQVSKQTMNVYYSTNCNSRPSSMDDIIQLANALRDADFVKKMGEQWSQFERKISFFHSLIGK